MRRGTHTIRSAYTNQHKAADMYLPREYVLDNGDFELNMQLTGLHIFPTSNDDTAGAGDKLSNETIFFVVSTSNDGALPQSPSISPEEYGPFDLRPSDSRQIAWGICAPFQNLTYTLIDPDHIIPENVFVNCWTLTTAGTLANQLPYSLGYMLKLEQRKSTGSEALLYQVKEASR